MRLGVYGGSFDPPHLGHVGAVRLALESGEIDRVVVAPVFQHAFAKVMEPFEERVLLCRLAFAELPGVEVSEIERELPAPNYTLHLLQALSARNPGAELRLIVGSDVLADLPRWHESERVRELAPLFLLGRRGFPSGRVTEFRLPEVSSSELRRALRAGSEAEAQASLPASVLGRIRERGSYR